MALPDSAAASSAKRWRDLKKRAISAAVLGPGALLCVWLGAEAWTALMTLAVAVLCWEWVRLCGLRSHLWPGMALPATVFVACALAVFGLPLLGLAWLMVFYLVATPESLGAPGKILNWMYELGSWNFLIGFGFMVAGLVMTMKWR